MAQNTQTYVGVAGYRSVADLFISTVAAVGEGAALILADVVNFASTKIEHRAQMRHLARLDDRLLDDIGVTRGDVLKQMEQPAWLL